MHKLIKVGITIFSIAALLMSQVNPVGATIAGWSAGRIIDDAVFTNTSTMSASAIQSFLNSKVPQCDTYGSQPSEYGGGTRAQWGQAKYGQNTFTCLKDYSESGKSAAQIIYNTAQKYQINPQVLIVLLQKEQGLVTDTWPLNIQYKTATGYGCPDTAPCDSQYYGLTNQLDWAGKMFRAILNNSPTWYTPYILGNNFIRYSPDSSCGGSSVNIQNRSTQALYNYTPYQPNQGALNAGYGSAPCGAYGNRNFYLYFTDWFGSTKGGPAYQWNYNSLQLYEDASHTKSIPGNQLTLAPGETAYAVLTATNMGTSSWDNNTILSTTNTPVIGNGNWIAYNRIARLETGSLSYGQTGSFKFSFTAPMQPGSYYQAMNINHNTNIWLNDPDIGIGVDVVSPLSHPDSIDSSTLKTGTSLLPDQSINSPYGRVSLRFENGTVSLYSDTKLVWQIGSYGSQAARFVNQPDGNIVLYDKLNKALWASNTNGKGSSDLRIQSDGNLVLYSNSGPSWASGTSTIDEINTVNYTLANEGSLFQNQFLTTPDRKHRLVMQPDGNLVLYSSSKAVWASNTDGRGGYRLVMQPDGNLVLYTKQNKALWASNRDGRGNSFLLLQSDRNVVTYGKSGATWATNTSTK